MTSVAVSPTAKVVWALFRPIAFWVNVNTVSTPNKDKLALPMMRRLTEYSAIMVRIPASSAGIFIFVVRKPVTAPASIPATAAARIAVLTLWPVAISVAAVAAPSGKLPSQVRSARSSTRNVTYTPRAITAHNKPCATVDTARLLIKH